VWVAAYAARYALPMHLLEVKVLTASNQNINVLIAGVGGQGVLVASQVIGLAAVNSGMKVRISEDIGQAQRGGPVVSHIRIGAGLYAPLIPSHTVDLVIGFEPLETYRNVQIFLKPEGDVIFNDVPVYPSWNPLEEELRYPPVEKMEMMMKKLAREVISFNALDLASKAGNPIAVNMVMLGAATAINLPFTPDTIKDTIKAVISRDIPGNLQAFDYGFQVVKEKVARHSREWQK
jgi:indolepyruvate ferredoxin oxidoreductase beta subunit